MRRVLVLPCLFSGIVYGSLNLVYDSSAANADPTSQGWVASGVENQGQRTTLPAVSDDPHPPSNTPLTGTVRFTGEEDFFFDSQNPIAPFLELAPSTSAGVALRGEASNAGFYRLDVPGANDTGTGVLITTVARNGLYLQGYPSGSDYSTNGGSVVEAAQEWALSTSRLSDFMPYDVDGAFGWFPLASFLGGVATSAGPDAPLTRLEASPGIALGVEVVAQATGETRIDLRELGAKAQDGILLASIAGPGDRVAGVIPNADGTFTVAVRQNQATNRAHSPISFVYLPLAEAGTVGGYLVAGGRVRSNGAAEIFGGRFGLGKLGVGRWLLTIPGFDDTAGTLLLTPQFGGPVSRDNTLSYEWDANRGGWVIEAREGAFAIFGLNDGATPDERFFNFAFLARDPLTEADVTPIFDDPVARLIRPRSDSLVGNGIDTATGAFMQGRELLRVEGVRPLTFDIAYNSRLTSLAGPMGTSWRHNYEARLEGSLGSTVTLFWDAHRHSRFTYVPTPGGAGHYMGVDEDVRFADLEPRLPDADFPDAFWSLAMKDGDRYLFDLNGRLVAVVNIVRQPIDLTYNATGQLTRMQDRFSAATIDLAYDAEGRVREVTDELGRVVSLAYDELGRLRSVPAPTRAEDAIAFGVGPFPVVIPDNNLAGRTVTIQVPEGGVISGFVIRSLEVQHSAPADLQMTLTSPAGTVFNLPAEPVSGTTNIIRFNGEVFDEVDEPERMGEWTLKVVDSVQGGTGTINSFQLSFLESTRRVDYSYDAANRIVAAHDALGEPLLQAEYDASGRIIGQIDARPETPDARIRYVSLGGPVQTTYTDPLGHDWTFLHDPAYRLLAATNPLGNIGSYTYDIDGLRLSFTDARGRETFFTYDDDGNVATMEDPLGYVTSFTYDEEHNVTTITDALGRTSEFGYGDGRLVQVRDELGHTDRKEYFDNGQVSLYDQEGSIYTEAEIRYTLDERKRVATSTNPNNSLQPFSAQGFTYDLAGRVLASTDFGGHVTVTSYTPAGDLRTRIDPAGKVERNDYDHRGRLIRQINRLNQTTTFTYDGNGNILTSTNALGETTSFVYDHDDRLLEVINPRGSRMSYAYDAVGRRIRTTDPIGRTEQTVFDEVGNVIQTFDASGTRTLQITYDERDLPIRTENALGHIVSVEYDALMRKTRATDELGRMTTFRYDELDRLVSHTDAAGRTGTATYRTDDMVDRINPPGAGQIWLEYDPSNNLIDIFDPNGAPETFRYNSRHQLSRYISLANRIIDFRYDNVGRLIESDPAGNQDKRRVYTYDDNDKLLTVSTPAGPEDFRESERTYDPLGRLSTYTRFREEGDQTVLETLTYAYDPAGNLSRLRYPDGSSVNYTYDPADRLIQVTDWAGRRTDITWDDRDNITRIDFPNGTRRQLNYDAAGQLIHREDLALDGSVIVAYAYGYDASGRLQSEVTTPEPPPIAPVPARFTYDNQNRLTSYNASPVQFDADGFITSAPAAPHLATLTYNQRARLTASAGYDFHYDEEDRLEGWHAQGAEASQATRFFVNPAAALSQILTSTGPTGNRRFVHGVGLFYEEDVATGEIRVFHYDYRGSTVALSGNDGSVAGRVVYSPYGRVASRQGQTETIFLYHALYGVVTSPEGLNYMRFRWYAPELARFLTRDVHYGSVANLGSMNRFAFARGNPAMYVDPEGEFWWVVGGAIAGAAIGTGVTLVTDLLDDGQLNTPAEEYGAAAIGGAISGGILAATGGLGAGAALGGAALAGGAGAAAESLSLAAFREQAVDPGRLAVDTVTGAAFSVAGFGAGKVAGKVGPKIYSKTFGQPGKFTRFLNSAFRPAKISRRQAIGSFGELVRRSGKREGTQRLTSFLLRTAGAVGAAAWFGEPTVSPPDTSSDGGGRRGTGTFQVMTQAIRGGDVRGPRSYGEYVHFNLYLDALGVADQPTPANPVNSLAGF